MMWFLTVLLLVLSMHASLSAESTCQGRYCSAHQNERVFEPKGETLKLVATGMRAKNLLVATVDVYSVGIYITSEKVKLLKKAKSVKFDVDLPSPINDKISLGVVLTFARNVGKSTMVEALVGALLKRGDSSVYESQVQQFKSLLTSSIDDKGVMKGEEIAFAWKGKKAETLLVFLKGQLVGSVDSSELRQKLATVYLGDAAVAPDVVSSLKLSFPK